MDGLINFRDVGGMKTRSGRLVKRGVLYRSGNFAQAATPAVTRLAALDFGLIVDLRYADERQAEPSPWPASWATRVIAHDGVGAGAPHRAMFAAAAIGPEAVDQAYATFYAGLPFDPDYRRLFGRTLRRVASEDGRLLIHCSAGKDRTGVLVALLLATLGVERTDILADFTRSVATPRLLTSDILARLHGAGHRVSDRAIEALLGVKPQYLDTAFAAIESRVGSVEAYLGAEGVDAEIVDGLGARLLTAKDEPGAPA